MLHHGAPGVMEADDIIIIMAPGLMEDLLGHRDSDLDGGQG